MIAEIHVLFLILAGIIGTVVALGLGYSESGEPFDKKKAISTLIRGSIGVVIYVIGTYTLATEVNIWDYLEVAIFAAGFDVLVKRGQAIAK
jgi:hypothetical protein